VAQVVIPVALAPLLLAEAWSSTPPRGLAVAGSLALVAIGGAILGRSTAVAWLVAQPPAASAPTGSAASALASSSPARELTASPQPERP
jgi:hypothetical protein